ncbi:membrane protein [Algibacter lectus]|uniref:Membrane protein n=1 Tax=Algibacter lectus TaxID=221126 RepID=A0A090WJK8_9FLAO|nr:membrane protein [Algibacter lectus]
MKDFLNKLYRNHSLIYKVLLFICTTFLIVYLFPKSGKFKYNFEKGKPWQSENLYAPFDFAIKKSESEINKEKEDIINNGTLYFSIDSSIENKVKTAFKKEFTTNFSDTISLTSSSELYKTGIDIISQLYAFGVLNESYSFSEEKEL